MYSDFEDVFKAYPGRVLLNPGSAKRLNWNQTEKIIDFAKFCPDAKNPVVKNGSDKYIYGTLRADRTHTTQRT